MIKHIVFLFFFSSRRRHTRCSRDWSSDVCFPISLALFIRPLAFGHVQGGANILDEGAGMVEHGVGHAVAMLDRAVWKKDSKIEFVIGLLSYRLAGYFLQRSQVVRVNLLLKHLPGRFLFIGIEAEDPEQLARGEESP